MSQLEIYESFRHELIGGAAWDPTEVELFSEEVTVATLESFQPSGLWPGFPITHQVPKDLRHLYDPLEDPEPWFFGVYSGSMGVILGIKHILKSLSLKSCDVDLEHLATTAKNKYFGMFKDRNESSYFFGDIGILFTEYVLTRNPEVDQSLQVIVETNLDLPSNELFWGTPGLLIVSWHMFLITRNSVWADLFVSLANSLWQKREVSVEYNCQLWTQDLDGCSVKHIGAAHGFFGNIHALLKGRELLQPELVEEIETEAVQTLQSTACSNKQDINWRQSVEGNRPERTAMLMQWCHGAPGIITSLCDLDWNRYDCTEILVEAGESVWRAGPLTKSVGGICHATAGNGYAFLVLYKKTGNPLWLYRARDFAMHSIKQYRRNIEQWGMQKFSLWTGDIGTVCYVLDCLHERSQIPTLDVV